MSRTGTTPDRLTCAPSRAARELDLKRGEFDLAVNLGLIRTVPDEGGGGRRVARAEIDRLRSGDGSPDTLRERVATVGTTEGARLMGVAPTLTEKLEALPAKEYNAWPSVSLPALASQPGGRESILSAIQGLVDGRAPSA